YDTAAARSTTYRWAANLPGYPVNSQWRHPLEHHQECWDLHMGMPMSVCICPAKYGASHAMMMPNFGELLAAPPHILLLVERLVHILAIISTTPEDFHFHTFHCGSGAGSRWVCGTAAGTDDDAAEGGRWRENGGPMQSGGPHNFSDGGPRNAGGPPHRPDFVNDFDKRGSEAVAAQISMEAVMISSQYAKSFQSTNQLDANAYHHQTHSIKEEDQAADHQCLCEAVMVAWRPPKQGPVLFSF
ncbi:hypothetical protein EVAR_71889_1, partial [Eumeta japonica]